MGGGGAPEILRGGVSSNPLGVGHLGGIWAGGRRNILPFSPSGWWSAAPVGGWLGRYPTARPRGGVSSTSCSAFPEGTAADLSGCLSPPHDGLGAARPSLTLGDPGAVKPDAHSYLPQYLRGRRFRSRQDWCWTPPPPDMQVGYFGSLGFPAICVGGILNSAPPPRLVAKCTAPGRGLVPQIYSRPATTDVLLPRNAPSGTNFVYRTAATGSAQRACHPRFRCVAQPPTAPAPATLWMGVRGSGAAGQALGFFGAWV